MKAVMGYRKRAAAPAGATGAEALVRSLLASGVDTCFTNPGTSEMHFVAALDRVDGMRCVLALFEGVATGAADGYARMTGRPASTLLHLGPGLANGLASLHNAHRALSPIVNIVGEHGTAHRQHDPPLHSDIAALARLYSSFVTTVESPEEAARRGSRAVAAAMAPPGASAPSSCRRIRRGPMPTSGSRRPCRFLPGARSTTARVRDAADALRQGKAALVLNGPLLRSAPLDTCGRIAAATGAELLAPTQVPRLQRGAGRVFVDRIPYVIDVGDEAAGRIWSASCSSTRQRRWRSLRTRQAEPAAAAGVRGAGAGRPGRGRHRRDRAPRRCAGRPFVTNRSASRWHSSDAPERARSRSPAWRPSLRPCFPKTPSSWTSRSPRVAASCPRRALPHRTTGSRTRVGRLAPGLPLAIGAAVACPDRKVVCLESDGSGMYTLQGLWTMAREQLDVTTVLFNNRSYEILKGEFKYVGAGEAGRKATDMLEIGRPDLDWVPLATAQGVPRRARRRSTIRDAFEHRARRTRAAAGRGDAVT